MKKKIRKNLLIFFVGAFFTILLIPTFASADWQGFRHMGAGVHGMNAWGNTGNGREVFVAGTSIDRATWSSNNTEWTKAHARYGSVYGTGSSYTNSFVGNTSGMRCNVSVAYSFKPKGFLGAYSNHSRNDKETAWRELVGYWGRGTNPIPNF